MPSPSMATLQDMTSEILRDLARNDSAPRDQRKAAVKLLLDSGHAYAHNPDLYFLVSEILKETAAVEEVKDIVTSAIEADVFEGHGPHASVTTKTMFAPENSTVYNIPADDGNQELDDNPQST